MKKFKKALALLLCAVLLVAGSVAGTLAYLQAKSDVVQNTFTVGNIQIKLDEAVVDDETGKETTGRTEVGNSDVRLLPGRTVDKDPTVTVLKNSEDCYVRVKVTVSVPNWDDTVGGGFNAWANNFASTYIRTNAANGFNTTNWEVGASVIGEKTITYTLTYKNGTDNIVEKNTYDNALPAVFTDIAVPGDLTNAQLAMLKDLKINVVAHAMQAEGLAEDAAWNQFNDSIGS